MIKIWVNYPAWSESEKCWFILEKCTPKTSSGGIWFPKKICTYEETKDGRGILSMPKWFFEKNEIKSKINENQII